MSVYYPNAENATVVAMIKDGEKYDDNVDYSIIKFGGESMTDEATFKQYEVNYESSTRGEKIKK